MGKARGGGQLIKEQKTMKDFLKYTLAVCFGLCLFFGACFVGFMSVFIGVTTAMSQYKKPVSGGVLVVDLSNPITECASGDSLLAHLEGGSRSIGLFEACSSIRAAAKDNMISAVLVCGSSDSAIGAMSLSAASEIRNELEFFKTSGKPVYAYLENPNLLDYYLASCADEIMLNPAGELTIAGLSVRGAYFKGALEKYGVGVQVVKAGKYKNYSDTFLSDKMSEEDKSHMKEILEYLWGCMSESILLSRGVSLEALDKIAAQKGVLSAREALSLKLADTLAPKDEVIDKLSDQVGYNTVKRSFNQCSLSEYAMDGRTARFFKRELAASPAAPSASNSENKGDTPNSSGAGAKDLKPQKADAKTAADQQEGGKIDPAKEALKAKLAARRYSRFPTGYKSIALVYLNGEIKDGPSDNSGISSEETASFLRWLRKGSSVSAVVLRVDSPGGSAFGSELIRREVELLAKEKPVVVSFGSVAASGAYWLSTPAKLIFCDELSIVGSIGVFGLMFNVEKLANSFGVTFDGVGTSPLAGMLDISKPKTPQQMRILQKRVDDVYAQFIDVVSKGRKLDVARVRALADGRVHCASKAKELGLVDEIGGLYAAMECARNLGGIQEGCQIEIYPNPLSFKSLFAEMFSDISSPFAKNADFRNPNDVLRRIKSLCGQDGVCARMPMIVEIE